MIGAAGLIKPCARREPTFCGRRSRCDPTRARGEACCTAPIVVKKLSKKADSATGAAAPHTERTPPSGCLRSFAGAFFNAALHCATRDESAQPKQVIEVTTGAPCAWHGERLQQQRLTVAWCNSRCERMGRTLRAAPRLHRSAQRTRRKPSARAVQRPLVGRQRCLCGHPHARRTPSTDAPHAPGAPRDGRRRDHHPLVRVAPNRHALRRYGAPAQPFFAGQCHVEMPTAQKPTVSAMNCLNGCREPHFSAGEPRRVS